MGIKEELENAGIRSTSDRERSTNFVGAGAHVTFKGMAQRLQLLFSDSNTDVATIGDAYKSAAYERSGTRERTYEHVYGDVDWTKAAEDPSTLQVLEEGYGNKAQSSDETEISPEGLRGIYGLTKTRDTRATVIDKSASLLRSRDLSESIVEQDTAGIRGVGDFDAPIAPYA